MEVGCQRKASVYNDLHSSTLINDSKAIVVVVREGVYHLLQLSVVDIEIGPLFGRH